MGFVGALHTNIHVANVAWVRKWCQGEVTLNGHANKHPYVYQPCEVLIWRVMRVKNRPVQHGADRRNGTARSNWHMLTSLWL